MKCTHLFLFALPVGGRHITKLLAICMVDSFSHLNLCFEIFDMQRRRAQESRSFIMAGFAQLAYVLQLIAHSVPSCGGETTGGLGQRIESNWHRCCVPCST